jgi:FixJ family two-component response regulator
VAPFGEPEAFLSYLSTHQVPVLVLDIWMEKMTGIEVLTYLCAQSPDTRVIFITGHKDHAAEAIVKQAGAFAFFIKPLDNALFLAAVNRAFMRSSAGQ